MDKTIVHSLAMSLQGVDKLEMVFSRVYSLISSMKEIGIKWNKWKNILKYFMIVLNVT